MTVRQCKVIEWSLVRFMTIIELNFPVKLITWLFITWYTSHLNINPISSPCNSLRPLHIVIVNRAIFSIIRVIQECPYWIIISMIVWSISTCWLESSNVIVCNHPCCIGIPELRISSFSSIRCSKIWFWSYIYTISRITFTWVFTSNC